MLTKKFLLHQLIFLIIKDENERNKVAKQHKAQDESLKNLIQSYLKLAKKQWKYLKGSKKRKIEISNQMPEPG